MLNKFLISNSPDTSAVGLDPQPRKVIAGRRKTHCAWLPVKIRKLDCRILLDPTYDIGSASSAQDNIVAHGLTRTSSIRKVYATRGQYRLTVFMNDGFTRARRQAHPRTAKAFPIRTCTQRQEVPRLQE